MGDLLLISALSYEVDICLLSTLFIRSTDWLFLSVWLFVKATQDMRNCPVAFFNVMTKCSEQNYKPECGKNKHVHFFNWRYACCM